MAANKTQTVRLIDVFILGPFMVYAGASKSNLPDIVKAGLVISGVLTSAYNWENYKNEKGT